MERSYQITWCVTYCMKNLGKGRADFATLRLSLVRDEKKDWTFI